VKLASVCDSSMTAECAVTSVLDISVLGHFGAVARLVCRILAIGCSGVSRVSRVRFRVKVRVRDRCREGGDMLFPNDFGEDLLLVKFHFL